MEAIVINRQLTEDEEQSVINRMHTNETELFSNITAPNKLKQFPFKKIDLSVEDKKKLNHDIFKRIINFGDQEIKGTYITDLLMIEKASIWHYHKFRSYFIISNLFHEIKVIEELTKKYDSIKVFSDKTLLENYFQSSQIELVFPLNKKKKTNYFAVLNYAIFFIARVLITFFNFNKLTKKNYIIIDHSIKQPCLNLQTLKPKPGNYNLQYLFDKADSEFIILDDVELPKLNEDKSFKLRSYHFTYNKKRINSEYIIVRGLISTSIRKKLKEYDIILKDKYSLLDKEIKDPFHSLVLEVLKSLHSSTKYFLFKYLTYQKFFGKYNFKTISSIDENSPRIKSILDAAKTTGMKAIGIQHGIIHDLQPSYHFTELDKSRKIPADHTLVWGNYWENKLYQQSNYPENLLIKTGFIRTDIIHRLIELKDKKLFNLPENKKLVIFASQPIKDANLRKKVALEVFKGLKDFNNCRLILKPHPIEMNDTEYYQEIAKEAGLKDLIINETIDLYLLISKADIVITSFSTVGLESVLFNKPLIIIDPLKEDVQNYHKNEVAFQASNNEELSIYIDGLTEGTISLNQEAYNKYLEEQVYKIDGNVANRCIEIIKSFNKPTNEV